MSNFKHGKYVNTGNPGKHPIENWQRIIRNKQKIIIAQRGITDNRQICKKFGCGKELTNIEALYSDYCFTHQQEINKNK